MKKIYSSLAVVVSLFACAHAQVSPTYWQQHVAYSMEIDFDHVKNQFKGKQTLVYQNNSPDTLHRVYYHLYYNAFQPGSVMDVRSQNLPDPDPRVKDSISKLTPETIGYHKIDKFEQNGKALTYEIEGTILEVVLNAPILPGASETFTLEFNAQVPVQIRRTGRDNKEGVEYSMTQWYPKMCAYDNEGWHADPYVGREFYGDFGSFDVKIKIHKDYVLGGTGLLQNAQEVGKGYEDQTTSLNLPQGDYLTWHFKADSVHDFAWAADPDYLHDILSVPNGPVLHFLYQNDETIIGNWKKLEPLMVKFFTKMNETFGKYPYRQFSFIQGGDGGMEYPMATLVTSSGNYEGLVGVCTHEAIHNWYYGVLATNESKYPWMDEGFTQFATDYMEDYLFETFAPNPFAGMVNSMTKFWNGKDREPLTTHADFYKKNRSYSSSAYGLGEAFLSQLIYIVGESVFYSGMRRYFNEWKFKHPRPEDFIHSMEKESGLELDWYLEQYTGSLNTIDLGITGIEENNGASVITLQNLGAFPMPVDLIITLTNGKKLRILVPLDIMRGAKTDLEDFDENSSFLWGDMQWVFPYYRARIDIPMSSIKKLEIDPEDYIMDSDRSNNELKP